MGLNLHNKNLDFLFKAVLALENVEECYDFFEDLCTVQELNAISQRIVVFALQCAGQRHPASLLLLMIIRNRNRARPATFDKGFIAHVRFRSEVRIAAFRRRAGACANALYRRRCRK